MSALAHRFAVIGSRSRVTAFDPASIAGLVRWYKPETLSALADGDPIGTWPDSSTSASDATQATGAAKPTYKTAIQNGLAVARFDGVDDLLALQSLAALTGGTAFVAIKAAADPSPGPGDSQTGLWHFGVNPGDTHYPYLDGTIYESFGTDARKTTVNPTPSLAAWHVYEVHSSSGAWENLLDGASLFSTATNTVAFPSAPLLGRGVNTPGFFLKGDIGEFLLYDSNLGSTDATAVRGYLKSKWATP